jgi:hypothetical protein
VFREKAHSAVFARSEVGRVPHVLVEIHVGPASEELDGEGHRISFTLPGEAAKYGIRTGSFAFAVYALDP